MQRMWLANHQYIIIRHSGTESKKEQAHLDVLANRVSLSGELYRDNWIGKKATEAANAIAKERNFVQSQDIGKANNTLVYENASLVEILLGENGDLNFLNRMKQIMRDKCLHDWMEVVRTESTAVFDAYFAFIVSG